MASAVAVCASREPEQMRGRGGGAEHAERRGRVPALVVMVEIDRAGDARLGLEAGDIGGDEVASRVARASSASANSAGSTGAEGWPPSVLLQSSKSSACDAVPLTSAASATARRAGRAEHQAGPGAAATRRTICAHGSTEPASVTPTVSRMPTFAHSTAASGSRS